MSNDVRSTVVCGDVSGGPAGQAVVRPASLSFYGTSHVLSRIQVAALLKMYPREKEWAERGHGKSINQ